MDLGKHNFIVPAPNIYKLGSSFDLNQKNGITIA
jgi:hypothetical protein